MLNSRPISDPAPVNMEPAVDCRCGSPPSQTLNMYFQTPQKIGSLPNPAQRYKVLRLKARECSVLKPENGRAQVDHDWAIDDG